VLPVSDWSIRVPPRPPDWPELAKNHNAAATSSPSTTTATAPDETQVVPELVHVVLAPNVAVLSASSASALVVQQQEKMSTESPE
jgi:hypothetical protein